ncbi:MAG: hypothetical protein J0L79_03800 [Rickettsiales bacterium]|nr:hypothetical protein [Rickettsiales bacterium]MCA0254156.1 hypothetical protein [Pseudomonadota bacterium]
MSKFAEFDFIGNLNDQFSAVSSKAKKARKKLSFKSAKKQKAQREIRVEQQQEEDQDVLTLKSVSSKRTKKVLEKSVQKSVEPLFPLEFLLPFDDEGNVVPFPFYEQGVLLPFDQHNNLGNGFDSFSSLHFKQNSSSTISSVARSKRKALNQSPEFSDEDVSSEQLTSSFLSQRSDDSLSPSINSQQSQIRKIGFQKALAESLHVQLPRHFLVDITEKDLLVVGRPHTHGSSKLHCHVIPFAFVKHMIKGLIQDSVDVKELVEKLSALVVMAAKSQKGFAIKSSDLELEEYRVIKPKMSQHSDRVIKGEGEGVFLASPGKQDRIFSTPSKMQKAAQEFSKYNLEFIASALRDIKSMILDHNTNVLFSEILSRYVFDLLNSGENVVFAKEGNTLRYEIRLYDDEEDALRGGDDYKVVSPRELKALVVPHSEASEEVYSRVRIVDAEGPHVKTGCLAIDQLNKILLDSSNLGYIANYNYNYNLKLILANYQEDLEVYNNQIDATRRIEDQVANHLAKILYCCLDLKAFEDVVFVASRKGYEVMVGAKGTRKVKYAFKIGEDYRDEEMNRATCREEFLRTPSKSREILPSKLAELFLIGTATFSSYFKLHEEFKVLCLSKLIEIAFKDYGIIEAEQMIFANQTKEALDSFNIDLLPNYISSPQLRLMGEEVGLREYLNGFSSDSSPSPTLGSQDSVGYYSSEEL